jgi:hypothetical protein
MHSLEHKKHHPTRQITPPVVVVLNTARTSKLVTLGAKHVPILSLEVWVVSTPHQPMSEAGRFTSGEQEQLKPSNNLVKSNLPKH